MTNARSGKPEKTDTRRAILDTARRVVAQKGYAAVGINEVLSTAGVPKGSFYHWFDSKDAFGAAMLESYFTDYLGTMDQIATRPERSSADRLMQYWQRFYETQAMDNCQGQCLVVKLGAEVADLSEPMRLALETGTTEIVARVEQMIVEGIADRSITIAGDAGATAQMLYQAWLGASVMAKIHRSVTYLDNAMTLTRQTLHTASS